MTIRAIQHTPVLSVAIHGALRSSRSSRPNWETIATAALREVWGNKAPMDPAMPLALLVQFGFERQPDHHHADHVQAPTIRGLLEGTELALVKSNILDGAGQLVAIHADKGFIGEHHYGLTLKREGAMVQLYTAAYYGDSDG